MGNSRGRKYTSMYVDPDDYAELDRIAGVLNTTRAHLIRQGIKAVLIMYKKQEERLRQRQEKPERAEDEW